MLDTITAARQPQAASAAVQALAEYSRSRKNGRPGWDRVADAGPAILSALAVEHLDGIEPPQVSAGLSAWLNEVRRGCTHLGLYSWGLGGIVLGLRTAARVWPSLASVTGILKSELVEGTAARPWVSKDVGWIDYDLVSGPAGIVLVLASDPDCAARDGRVAVDQMIDLCTRDDLAGLRLGQFQNEELRGWNYGRVNTGVAHGVAGVALALCAATDSWEQRNEIDSALRRIARWLQSQAYSTPHNLMTWSRAEGRANPPGARDQNAWCYGNPGISWTLWEIGRILSDEALQRFARDSFKSFLTHGKQHSPSDLHGFNMCHGRAGEMITCDAFYRYAHLEEAKRHRDELEQFMLTHLDQLVRWSAQDPTLLSGASGALAALLTVRGGDRRWLAAFGLR